MIAITHFLLEMNTAATIPTARTVHPKTNCDPSFVSVFAAVLPMSWMISSARAIAVDTTAMIPVTINRFIW